MRALVIQQGAAFHADYPEPHLEGDQALIRMIRVGICNTDLEIMNGYMGFQGIPGHEFVGEVVQCPSQSEWIGRRVVGEINVADGTCDLCQQGIPSQCRHRTTVGIHQHDGAFADYLALTTRNLHIVPDNVTDDQAVFVEPLAAALQVTSQVHIMPRDQIALIGAGKLGLLVAQVLKLTGADISVVVRREKPARLLAGWGIRAAEFAELPRKRFPYVVDCTGTSEGFAAALTLVQPRGKIILKSTYVGLPAADLTRVVVDEIQVIGSRCGPFEAALRLLEHGMIDVNGLIEARYPIDQGLTALTAAAQPGMLKVLLSYPD
jgi:alcohol dehydrogenase